MHISDKAKTIIVNCRFCWMCRHVCPIGNATGLERNTARGRAFCAALITREMQNLEDMQDNLYECALCGACTNNCITGWDPKVFIREMRTALALEGKLPDYILKLVENFVQSGNVYGASICDCIKDLISENNADVLVLMGEDAVYKNPEAVLDVNKLLGIAQEKFTFGTLTSTGNNLYFLIGKTAETLDAAKKAAEYINKFKKVVVYDPVDLSFIMHEFNEWGIEVKAETISFNEYLLSLIKTKKLAVKNSGVEYTLQDNYAYARELEQTFGRDIIKTIGKVKDVLLIGKETNFAGNLIMNEYMPNVMNDVASNRWQEAKRMNCEVFVTENPAEYVLLKKTTPDGNRIVSMEQAILENL